MTSLIATLHVLGLRALDRTDDQIDVLRRAREDRGSVTIEQVLWAVAAITIAGIVVFAVQSFVEGKASEIK
ncbi:hypothetical protein AWH69_04000 [Janibacter melonis]|uniref:Uncharacterized protein n=1 Tax=Janibacter melonis TaxID=262209 RepID=A0A176QGU3_9MICO|nr:hypothetical protein [Janibacter melonis]MBD5830601.1 hypothetical protein [Janibacter melonis]OAB88939.1 hypothetical protein AWH69_04000 [Janibacter melonis]